ncbi:MAG TPA: CvpA family protein [Candidatus Omnitrophota bacterium]|nr:CvpA family protein [Candidatus Omnitrophota bacterium]HQL41909.1 CvpA family protein [Candidatus Omnitrophota bacterium]
MLLETISKFNWIDIVIIMIALRALYIGLKRGFVSELFHLLAMIVVIFAVFHYYPLCARFLEKQIFFKLGIAKAMAFVAIWIVVALIAKFVRDGVNMVFKIEAKSFIDKFGGLFLACGRAMLVSSLMLCFFSTMQIEYLSRHIQRSYFSPKIITFAPDIYRGIYNTLISKYFPNEKINPDVVVDPDKRPASVEHKDPKKK